MSETGSSSALRQAILRVLQYRQNPTEYTRIICLGSAYSFLFAAFLLGLLFHPEDGECTFLRNVDELYRIARRQAQVLSIVQIGSSLRFTFLKAPQEGLPSPMSADLKESESEIYILLFSYVYHHQHRRLQALQSMMNLGLLYDCSPLVPFRPAAIVRNSTIKGFDVAGFKPPSPRPG
jgi:hypothetical protein